MWEKLSKAVSDQPADFVSQERVSLANDLDVGLNSLRQWWIESARPKFGGNGELAWLRLGAPMAGGHLLKPEDLGALALPDNPTIAAAIAAGVTPPAGSLMEDKMLKTVLAGHCSDVASPRFGLIGDMVNALAPREFIHLAKPEDAMIFELRSAHYDRLMPPLERRKAFRRLKKTDQAFKRSSDL